MPARIPWLLAPLALIAACSSSDEKKSTPDTGSTGCPTYDTTFEAIQAQIFDKKGCTQDACHGRAESGGLDLRDGKSLTNLVDARSQSSDLVRVEPGTANASFLYQKLLAATEPGSVEITGSPMPAGGVPPLTRDELEAVRLWIARGAPATGSVLDDHGDPGGIGKLLDACLPDTASPSVVKPLEAPAPGTGVQFVLPTYALKQGTEVENCTPFAFDFRDSVPDEFKDATRNVMYVEGEQVRQDAQSHHLVLLDTRLSADQIAALDPGEWTCHDGERDGQSCDSAGGSKDCPGGVCAGKTFPGVGCIGAQGDGVGTQIANAQAPQQYIPPRPGVYWEVPLSGVVYYNSHSFNLTADDTVLHGRINFTFASDRRRKLIALNEISNLTIAAGQPPFTRQTYCAKHTFPQGASLLTLSGHTHRRGRHFWANDSSGNQIYDNTVYNDPVYQEFDPWMTFDADDDAARTVEYCATYDNGLTEDGVKDLSYVTRASKMPDRTSCTPVACVKGKVGAACTTDADCESEAGAGDGSCDACPITAGVTTENEMFVLMAWYAEPEAK
jgi:hypothetical protein